MKTKFVLVRCSSHRSKLVLSSQPFENICFPGIISGILMVQKTDMPGDLPIKKKASLESSLLVLVTHRNVRADVISWGRGEEMQKRWPKLLTFAKYSSPQFKHLFSSNKEGPISTVGGFFFVRCALQKLEYRFRKWTCQLPCKLLSQWPL